jgi:hypothetical protein
MASLTNPGSGPDAAHGNTPIPGERRPRIAVIAVHGVADQKPGASADAVAKLLLTLPPPAAACSARYSSFREISVRIPARPLTLSARYPAPGHAEEPDHYFTRKLLRFFRPNRADGVYTTTRLEGRRLAQDGKAEADVHVYEMYWADLSRLGTGVLGMLGATYQLLVHLPNLGRRVVREAVRENAPPSAAGDGASRDRGVWAWYRRAHRGAVFLLTTAIPALNVFLFAIALTVLPQLIPPRMQAPVAFGSLALAAMVAAGTAMYRYRHSLDIRYWWAFPPLATGLACAAAAWLFGDGGAVGRGGFGLHHLLALEWWGVTAALVLWMFARFNAGHPGAKHFAYLAGALSTGLFFSFLFRQPNGTAYVAEAALWTFEAVFAALQGLWMLFCIAGVVATALGWAACRRAGIRGDRAARDRARRAANTARLTLTLSATAFLALTLTIGCGLAVFAAQKLLPHDVLHQPLLPFPGPPERTLESLSQAEFLVWLLGLSATPIVWISLSIAAIAAGLALWVVAPSAIAEIRPPVDPGDDESMRMGRWLTKGFPLLRVAGHLLWANLFLVAPIGLLSVMPIPGYERAGVFSLRYMEPIQASMVAVGSLLVASVVGLVALRSRLVVLADACRPALDILLDVDNYLRDYPRERTPRARIFHRYVALLRYVCSRRDELNHGYSSVVIVAHSQGAVITADLLRFLKTELATHRASAAAVGLGETLFEPELFRVGLGANPAPESTVPLPVYLFTMGSPLRQLYAANFPHLYGWVDRADGPLPGPDPATLGVRQWVNAYRTGDYVGRDLWAAESDDARFCHSMPPIAAARREMCIGAGAHTHYWDKTAFIIGDELDRLIAIDVPPAPASGARAYYSLETVRLTRTR